MIRDAPAIPNNAIQGSTSLPVPAVNFLLEALVRERPSLRDVSVEVARPVGYEFHLPGEVVTDVYFPVGGVLSLALPGMRGNRPAVEASTVGCEGVVGLPRLLGVEISPYRVIQQLPGPVARIPARDLCLHIESGRRAARVLKRFTAFSLQLAEQNAVCNLLHDVRQRACRWLLNAADRTYNAPIPSTQAMLAATLGVRRQTVSELVVSMQRDGLISYTRTLVTLVDRAGLEAQACECYAAARTRYQNVVGVG